MAAKKSSKKKLKKDEPLKVFGSFEDILKASFKQSPKPDKNQPGVHVILPQNDKDQTLENELDKS